MAQAIEALNELRLNALVGGWLVIEVKPQQKQAAFFQIWSDILPALIIKVELNDLEASILKQIVQTFLL